MSEPSHGSTVPGSRMFAAIDLLGAAVDETLKNSRAEYDRLAAELDAARAAADGYKNGQLQVQALFDSLWNDAHGPGGMREQLKTARAEVARLTSERDGARALLAAKERGWSEERAAEKPVGPLNPAFRAGYTEGFGDGYRVGLRSDESLAPRGVLRGTEWSARFRAGLLRAATIVESSEAGLGTIGQHVAGLIRKEAEK